MPLHCAAVNTVKWCWGPCILMREEGTGNSGAILFLKNPASATRCERECGCLCSGPLLGPPLLLSGHSWGGPWWPEDIGDGLEGQQLWLCAPYKEASVDFCPRHVRCCHAKAIWLSWRYGRSRGKFRPPESTADLAIPAALSWAILGVGGVGQVVVENKTKTPYVHGDSRLTFLPRSTFFLL